MTWLTIMEYLCTKSIATGASIGVGTVCPSGAPECIRDLVWLVLLYIVFCGLLFVFLVISLSVFL